MASRNHNGTIQMNLSDFVAKLVATIALLGITLLISVLTMIKGWGLEPKSWIWIIGVGFIGHLVVSVVTMLISGNHDD